MRLLIAAAAAVTLAACGGSQHSTSTTARQDAHDLAVRQRVENGITARVNQDAGQALGASGGATGIVTIYGTTCLPDSTTALSCQVTTSAGEQTWSATIDPVTGRWQATRDT